MKHPEGKECFNLFLFLLCGVLCRSGWRLDKPESLTVYMTAFFPTASFSVLVSSHSYHPSSSFPTGTCLQWVTRLAGSELQFLAPILCICEVKNVMGYPFHKGCKKRHPVKPPHPIFSFASWSHCSYAFPSLPWREVGSRDWLWPIECE